MKNDKKFTVGVEYTFDGVNMFKVPKLIKMTMEEYIDFIRLAKDAFKSSPGNSYHEWYFSVDGLVIRGSSLKSIYFKKINNLFDFLVWFLKR